MKQNAVNYIYLKIKIKLNIVIQEVCTKYVVCLLNKNYTVIPQS